MTEQKSGKKLALLVGMLVALSPMATDAYLPAVPTMAEFFGVKVSYMQTSIAVYFLGLGFGLMFGGPLSDHFGRRRLSRIGLFVFLTCCLGIIFAPSADIIIGLRLFQAVGGGFVTVVGPAIVRDRFDGKEAARIFALIGLIMGIAPLVAPGLGSFILLFLGWHWIFFVIALYALVLLLVIMPRMPERQHKPEGSFSVAQVMRDYLEIFRNKRAVGYIISQSFCMTLVYIFLTGSSFLYISYFGVSEEMFPFLFGSNMVMAMVLNRTNPILLNFFSPHQILGMGLTLQCAAMAGFVLLNLTGYARLEFVFPLMILGVGCMGLTASNGMTCFMSYFPEKSGTASGVFGTAQYFVGGIIGSLTGVVNDGTLTPMSIVMLSTTVAALMGYFFLAGGASFKLPILRRGGD
ncbi:multidrug effflux MFS transporter [Emcibacter nanhaiensis]|uniref:Bcr/CflA family efflux transporter n=1 Tax=Emcibacter nanhaiensis TaxID=1505037 RepID=A0A501PHL8_9PROT|nr:multidrug effflux MFS transporter [Emcibacter nanhaiensis]TPD59434.1 multidrug effflux MFS transporter [Emcibacter nanhaiensis]